MRTLAIILAAWSLAGSAMAITYMESREPDPFAPGATCTVQQLGSWGSYVYQYPSRFDMVFHPFVDDSMIWRCPKSGFVSHAADFEAISPGTRDRVAAWLKANPANLERLDAKALRDRMEAIYRERGMDDDFWSRFYRMRAYWSETAAEGDSHRARALPLLLARLARTDLNPQARLETTYLVGYYTRRGGDAETARKYFAAMKDVDWSAANVEEVGSKADNLRYFETMMADIEAGKLDGPCGQTGHSVPGCAAGAGAEE